MGLCSDFYLSKKWDTDCISRKMLGLVSEIDFWDVILGSGLCIFVFFFCCVCIYIYMTCKNINEYTHMYDMYLCIQISIRVYIYICLSIYLSVFLSIYPSVYLSIQCLGTKILCLEMMLQKCKYIKSHF